MLAGAEQTALQNPELPFGSARFQQPIPQLRSACAPYVVKRYDAVQEIICGRTEQSPCAAGPKDDSDHGGNRGCFDDRVMRLQATNVPLTRGQVDHHLQSSIRENGFPMRTTFLSVVAPYHLDTRG